MHEEVLTDSYGRQGTIFLAVMQHLHMTGAIPLLVPSLPGTLCCGYPVVGVRPKYIWLSDRHGPFKHRREARLIDCYVAKANKKLQAGCFKIVSRIAYLLW